MLTIDISYSLADTRSEVISERRKADLYGKIKKTKDLLATDEDNALLHSELANNLALLGKLEEALLESDIAISIEPNNPNILLDRALIFMDLNEIELAIENLNKIIEMDPNITSAYMNLSSIYRNRGEYDKAIGYCKEALKIRKDVDFYYQLATIYEEIGEYEKARAYYEWTISSDRMNSQFSKIAKEKIEEIDELLRKRSKK